MLKTLTLIIKGLPHCPRNRSHSLTMSKGRPMNIKTEAARQYEKALMQDLEPYEDQAHEFFESFNSKRHHLNAFWILSSPDVLTKAGHYSQTGTDLDAHKVLQDTIMKFVGIDDGYIAMDTRAKIQGDYKVEVTLTIRENDGSDLL